MWHGGDHGDAFCRPDGGDVGEYDMDSEEELAGEEEGAFPFEEG